MKHVLFLIFFFGIEMDIFFAAISFLIGFSHVWNSYSWKYDEKVSFIATHFEFCKIGGWSLIILLYVEQIWRTQSRHIHQLKGSSRLE